MIRLHGCKKVCRKLLIYGTKEAERHEQLLISATDADRMTTGTLLLQILVLE